MDARGGGRAPQAWLERSVVGTVFDEADAAAWILAHAVGGSGFVAVPCGLIGLFREEQG